MEIGNVPRRKLARYKKWIEKNEEIEEERNEGIEANDKVSKQSTRKRENEGEEGYRGKERSETYCNLEAK